MCYINDITTLIANCVYILNTVLTFLEIKVIHTLLKPGLLSTTQHFFEIKTNEYFLEIGPLNCLL